jgi:cytochrome c
MVRRTLRSRPAARNAGHDATPEPHDAMNDLEVNKVVAAILSAGVLWMGATLISDALVSPTLLKKTAIAIAVPQAGGKPPPELSLAALLQTASAKRGEADTQRVGCTACHDFSKGGHAIVGPPLYGVVGRPVASLPGFDYSAALKAHHGPWTYAELNKWITKPAEYAPGTKMTFAGLDDAKERADIIMYLRSLSPKPEPLPPAPKVAAAAPKGPNLASMPPAQQVAYLMQGTNPAEGHAIMERVGCTACHSVVKGGPAIVGPSLWGVVGRPVASQPGFAYSDALKKHHGPWTYAEIFQWIKDPAAYAPGTKMTFAGLADPKQRAEVISYLRTLSDKPEPMPAPPGGAAATSRAPSKKTEAVAPAAPNLSATSPAPNTPAPSAGTAAAPAATAGAAAAASTSPAPKSPAPGAATPPPSSP